VIRGAIAAAGFPTPTSLMSPRLTARCRC
jgi:hypothetical protein